MNALYPLFLNLQGRVCLVVGGNEMAEAGMAETKIRELLDADASIRVIAPVATDQIAAVVSSRKVAMGSPRL